MRTIIGLTLALGFTLAATGARAAVPAPLEPLAFLLGDWEAGTNAGPHGQASGSSTFTASLQGRVIVRTNHAEYPGSATAPPLVHDDLMVIYAPGGSGIEAHFYDSEGHVIHYSASVAAPGQVSFVSDVVTGAPRFRLTYKLDPGGSVQGEFAIAPPGKPEAFSQYLAWEMHRRKADGK